jgi:xanthine dehydrogenase accessory factor
LENKLAEHSTKENKPTSEMSRLRVLIRGAGEMASGVAVRLFRSNFRVALTEIPAPLCIRRRVSFCEALFQERVSVEGCEAVLARNPDEVHRAWSEGTMAVIVDPDLAELATLAPDVLVDAILAKKNLNLHKDLAELVIALGPGFTAGPDAHVVIETNRGHNLGRLLYSGQAESNTGVPGDIAGQSKLRVLRAPADGPFETELEIGASVKGGQVVARVDGKPLVSELDGTLRGLIRPGALVWSGLKVGDVDPRGKRDYCWTVSDKARAIGGSVLEAIMAHYNR